MADSWDVKSGDSSILAVPINSTQTTGIKIAAMDINGETIPWATQSGGVILVTEQVDGTTKREWINFTGGTENADETFTLSGVTRGIDRDASTRTTATAGQSFNKGSSVKLVDFHLLHNQKADVDRANTFTADQTFDDDLLFSGTDKQGLVVKSLTTTQRDNLGSVDNGSIIYNSTTGQLNQRVGGAWTAVGDTGTVDGSTTVAGKFEEATVAEQGSATTTGGSGARLVPANANLVKTSSGAGDENKLAVLNGSGVFAQNFLGTGTANSDTVLKGDGTWGAAPTGTPLFGDGSDGAKSISSSENLDPTSEYEYTTFTLDASQTLGVSSNNTPLIIKATGNVTINGIINLDENGGAGGNGGTGSDAAANNHTTGGSGTGGNSMVATWINNGGSSGGKANGASGGGGGGGSSVPSAGSAGGSGGGGSSGGAGGVKIDANQLSLLNSLKRGLACGAGGGGGAGGGSDGGQSAGGNGGVGGAGGGALMFYIGGNLTFGASSTVTANGEDGTAGVNASGPDGGSGGGGGGGTVIFIVAGSITDSGLTKTANGGAGGSDAGIAGGDGGAGAAGKILIYSLQDGTLITS